MAEIEQVIKMMEKSWKNTELKSKWEEKQEIMKNINNRNLTTRSKLRKCIIINTKKNNRNCEDKRR